MYDYTDINYKLPFIWYIKKKKYESDNIFISKYYDLIKIIITYDNYNWQIRIIEGIYVIFINKSESFISIRIDKIYSSDNDYYEFMKKFLIIIKIFLIPDDLLLKLLEINDSNYPLTDKNFCLLLDSFNK